MRGVRVLVVEDEVPLAKLIREGLVGDGLLADASRPPRSTS